MTWAAAALVAALAAPPGPPPDLSRAEPQVRAAIEAAHDRLRREPPSPQAWGRYAVVLGVHEFLAQGVSAAQQAERLAPGDFRWPYLIGVWLAQDDPRASLAALERALARRDTYAPLHLRYAAKLEYVGRPAEARAAYRRAVELEPRNPWAHAGLARRLLDDGDREEAGRHFRRAVELDADCRPALAGLVAWHRRAGDEAAADRFAELAATAPAREPPDAILDGFKRLAVGTSAVLARADELTRAGRHVAARRELEALVAANPASARGHAALGETLLREYALQEAQEHFRRALELSPGLLAPRLGLGRTLTRLGRSAEAIEAFEAVLAAHPTSAEAHNYLAVSLASEGRLEEAAVHFRRAIELAPQSERSRLGHAQALLFLGQAGPALESLAPLRGDRARSPEVDALAGLAQAALGRYPEAAELLGPAAAREPSRLDLCSGLARALVGAGRHDEALAVLRRGRRLHPRAASLAVLEVQLLAASPDDGVRDGAAAVELAERWAAATGRRVADVLDVLACAYAETGRWEEAVAAGEQALTLARVSGGPSADAIARRWEGFRRREPYRIPRGEPTDPGEATPPTPGRRGTPPGGC